MAIYFKRKYPTIQEFTVKSFLKKYNEQVRLEKNLNQPPAECTTNLNRGRPLMVGPVIDEKVQWHYLKALDKLVTELHRQPQMFHSAEVKICLLKILKQHQCGDVIDDLRYLHFSRMRTAWQTIGNIFSIISGGQAGVVNVR